MKNFATILLVLLTIGLAKAQGARLRFDSKWKMSNLENTSFSLSKKLLVAPQIQQTPMPQAWCYSDLAFFCKIEVKMEKAARFPVKFRLGDVQYVDQLEGKRPSY